MSKVNRMEGNWKSMHGHKGDSSWDAPRLVAASDESNRADQGNHIKANEYLDEPHVLEAKVDKIVEFIRKSKCCCAYTGAGLSRAAGIGDYASKSKNSITNDVPKLKSGLHAQPTYAHKVIVALEKEGYLHHYVQQNHDGLPQKAGFPQEKINEIHGAWYDPSNPVVKFSGNLRGDLFDWMEQMEHRVDLCLCLGTSLSGMNADRMADTPAERSKKSRSNVLGTIIINLQQTRLDSQSALRIWAKLDDTFKLLAEKLNLDLTPISIEPPISEYGKDQYVIPYNAKGEYDPNSRMVWDIRDHSKIIISNPLSSKHQRTGEIFKKDNQGNYVIHLGRSQYRFGRWWIKCAMEGKWPYVLPFVNIHPKMLSAKIDCVDLVSEDNDVIMKEEDISPSNIIIKQTHKLLNNESHEWSLSIPSHDVSSVTWILHPTFSPPEISSTEYPFHIKRIGWGTFTVRACITLKTGNILKSKHSLSFNQSESETIVC
mmetsp:Transcript_31111/g.53234  ORF Transcript_31111/g.53234 Transcript_31111/m.53234 type:complete len:485 (-) Transcript_31111:64-1518(-)